METKNKLGRFFLPLFLFFILLVTSVFSAPPFLAEESFGDSLFIAHPIFNYYESDSNITLHFHVHNSTFFLLNESQVDCFIHVYNEKQKHILIENLTFEDVEFEIEMDKDLFEIEMAYQYLVYCNGSQAGVYSNGFIISKDGKEATGFIDDTPRILLYIFITLFALLFLIFMHIFKEDNVSIAYGYLSGFLFFLEFVFISSGFNLIRNTVFIVDVNYYLGFLFLLLSMYCFTISYFFYKDKFKKTEDVYGMRK